MKRFLTVLGVGVGIGFVLGMALGLLMFVVFVARLVS